MNSVVYKNVILALVLKRFISQEEISPLARTTLKFVETVMMGPFLLSKLFFYHH